MSCARFTGIRSRWFKAAHTKTSGGEPDCNAICEIQNRAVGAGLSAARVGGGRRLSANGRGALPQRFQLVPFGDRPGQRGRLARAACCTRAADRAAPTEFPGSNPGSRSAFWAGSGSAGEDAVLSHPVCRIDALVRHAFERNRSQHTPTSPTAPPLRPLILSLSKERRTGLGLASPCPGPATFPRESARYVTYLVHNVKENLAGFGLLLLAGGSISLFQIVGKVTSAQNSVSGAAAAFA